MSIYDELRIYDNNNEKQTKSGRMRRTLYQGRHDKKGKGDISNNEKTGSSREGKGQRVRMSF